MNDTHFPDAYSNAEKQAHREGATRYEALLGLVMRLGTWLTARGARELAPDAWEAVFRSYQEQIDELRRLGDALRPVGLREREQPQRYEEPFADAPGFACSAPLPVQPASEREDFEEYGYPGPDPTPQPDCDTCADARVLHDEETGAEIGPCPDCAPGDPDWWDDSDPEAGEP